VKELLLGKALIPTDIFGTVGKLHIWHEGVYLTESASSKCPVKLYRMFSALNLVDDIQRDEQSRRRRDGMARARVVILSISLFPRIEPRHHIYLKLFTDAKKKQSKTLTIKRDQKYVHRTLYIIKIARKEGPMLEMCGRSPTEGFVLKSRRCTFYDH
jgi:hypothetical protein